MCGFILWCIPFWVTLTLARTSFLGFSCLEHNISFIRNNFPQMCLMVDQFFRGHSSCYCDISCLNMRLQLSSARGLNFGLVLHLYLYSLMQAKIYELTNIIMYIVSAISFSELFILENKKNITKTVPKHVHVFHYCPVTQ